MAPGTVAAMEVDHTIQTIHLISTEVAAAAVWWEGDQGILAWAAAEIQSAVNEIAQAQGRLVEALDAQVTSSRQAATAMQMFVAQGKEVQQTMVQFQGFVEAQLIAMRNLQAAAPAAPVVTSISTPRGEPSTSTEEEEVIPVPS